MSRAPTPVELTTTEFDRVCFEPNCRYGRKDRDGEPFPFGYISKSPTPVPIFALQTLLVFPKDQLSSCARKLARAYNSHDDLVSALEDILNYSGGADSALDDPYVMERAAAALSLARGASDAA